MNMSTLRISETVPLPAIPVTDTDCRVDQTIDTRNTAEAAMKRLGFVDPDPERDAYLEMLRSSTRGESCYGCQCAFRPQETMYKQTITRRVVFGLKRETVSYCESCEPSYWSGRDGGYCRTCERIVYFREDRRRRRHIFCSDRCKREHYSKEQRDKRLIGRQKVCDLCDTEFLAPRSDKKFCSATCKQKAYRARGSS